MNVGGACAVGVNVGVAVETGVGVNAAVGVARGVNTPAELRAATSPPIAVISAAIAVRIPGSVVQNGCSPFLLFLLPLGLVKSSSFGSTLTF